MKIKVKKINKNLKLPRVLVKGDWIDLYAGETIKFTAPQSGTLKTRVVDGKDERYRNVSFDFKLIPLGIAVLLPDGYEANIVPRSSTAKGMGIIQGNHFAVIDGGPFGYNGPDDEWKYPAIALRDTTIQEGERICQFRINLSQKATVWQKIKWLFSSKIEIEEVEDLPAKENRGGFGTTGK